MSSVNMEGVRLEFSSGRPALTSVNEINTALAPFGSRVWQLDLRSTPDEIRGFLNQRSLKDKEAEEVLSHFLLSRERILDIIVEAGRTPQVPGGGKLSTLDSTHDIMYPQLYVVMPGIDFTRFDRFHVNTADDGTGVDEVIQVLCGEFRVLQHLPNEGPVTLNINCNEEDKGWIVTYDGAYPHIGSISGARPGTKVLVQVIGPASWQMRYEDET